MNDSDERSAALRELLRVSDTAFEGLNRGRLPEKGGLLFKKGKVGEIELEGSGRLRAKVGKVKPWLRIDRGAASWSCECKGHQEFGVCEHAAALAVKAYQEARTLANSGSVVCVSQTVDHVSTHELTVDFSRDYLHAEVLAPYGTPPAILGKLGLMWCDVDRDLNLVAMLDHTEKKSFFELLERARATGIGIRVIFKNGGAQRLSFEVVKLEGRTELFLKGGRVCVSKVPKGMVLEEGRSLFKSVYVSQDGAIVRVAEYSADTWRELLLDAERIGFNMYGRHQYFRDQLIAAVPRPCFNGAFLSRDYPGILDTAITDETEPELASPADLAMSEVTFVYAISTPSSKVTDVTYTLELTAWAGGRKLYLSELFKELEDDIKALKKKVRAPGKKLYVEKKIRELVAYLLQEKLEGKREFDRCSWSQGMVERWAKSRIALQAFPNSKKERWMKVELPLNSIALLTLSLFPFLDSYCSHSDDPILYSSPVAFKKEFLLKMFSAAEKVGAEVRFNRRRAKLCMADVLLESKQGGWLHSWIETDVSGVDIPMEEWHRLLEGNLYLETKDKGVLVPLARRPEAVKFAEALMKKLPSSERGGASFGERSSPLEFLAWLAAKAVGVHNEPPERILEILRSLSSLKGIERADVAGLVKTSLYRYQVDGISWLRYLKRNRLGACLADEMGLGKTIQTIAFLASDKRANKDNRRPSLVVAPLSMLTEWESQIARFCPDLTTLSFHGSSGEQRGIGEVDVVLTTYDTLSRKLGKLGKLRFENLVLDEAQACKNSASKRWAAVASINRQFTIALTGTPLENRATELEAIMDLALPGFAKLIETFSRKRSAADYTKILAHCAKPFILRRRKDEVLKGLPQKTHQVISLPMEPAQASVYLGLEAEAKLSLEKIAKGESPDFAFFAALTRLRQVCVSPSLTKLSDFSLSPKIEYVLKDVGRQIKAGRSCLIFSQFTGTLDLLGPELSAAGIPFSRIDGKVKSRDRRQIVKRFQESKDAEVLLVSLKAGGTGLTLTKANVVYLLDPWWNPAVDDQAIDRAHRIGQTKDVEVFRLIMQGTLEEKVLLLQESKRQLFAELVDDPSSISSNRGGLSAEDFRFLFSMVEE